MIGNNNHMYYERIYLMEERVVKSRLLRCIALAVALEN